MTQAAPAKVFSEEMVPTETELARRENRPTNRRRPNRPHPRRTGAAGRIHPAPPIPTILTTCPESTMLVNKRSLQEIFDPNGRFEAPLFQRPYVWNEEDNWQPLWESINRVADRRVAGEQQRPYFLGTIVLDQDRFPTGSIPTRQIIDGQQRLTTLQLLLGAVRDLCQEWKADDYRQAFELLTKNNTPLSKNETDKFKVWPTNVDQQAFQATMSAGSASDVAAVRGKNPDSRIPQAYEFFSATLREWLVGPTDPSFSLRVPALYATLREDLSLVVIDLDQQDDAQVIFETLNAFGTPLLPADLVKNFLFHQARIDGQKTEEVYKQYWQQFDDEQSFWRQELSRGRVKTPQIDIYLYHYLVSMLGEDISTNQLFERFRAMTRAQAKPAVEQIKRFKEYAEIYRSFSEFPDDSREGVFFGRLSAMEMSTLFPLLLEVFRRMRAPEDVPVRTQILQDLESFMVRRMICGLTTKGYSRFVSDAVRKLREKDDFTAPTIRFLLLEQKAESSRWPDDGEFRTDWKELRIYKKLTRGRTRMILQALDRGLHTSKTEGYQITGTLSIEHLLPQTWQKHWPLPKSRVADNGVEQMLDAEEAEEWRNGLLHTIGNLILVTEELNSSVSNGPWLPKKTEILKHSAMNLNRQLQSVTEWDERAILKRSLDLFELARQIWPRPAIDAKA
jgi:hypothetical protein